MKKNKTLLVLLLSAVVASGVSLAVGRGGIGAPSAKETRLEQVKRTGIIRCGYVIWPPFNTRDPNTGKMGGAFYDIIEEIGRQLSLKIEWTAEIAPGHMLSDLALNRYDMVCSPLGITPSRVREGGFTKPFIYAPIYLYVRKDDTRFDKDFMEANKPDVTFATLDGEFSAIGANETFPVAKKFSVTQISTGADLYMVVASKKADAVLQDPFSFAVFNEGNPGLLRPAGGRPLRVVSAGFPIPANEPAYKDMLDATLSYLQDSGFIDRTLKRDEGATKYLRPAKSYAE